MRSFSVFILLLAAFFPVKASAQEIDTVRMDSTVFTDSIFTHADTTVNKMLSEKLDSAFIKKEKFTPNPTKALIYSAIFPGLGQIYNKKYWKLPIVYGGFLGCVYAITWNNTQYTGYKKAYMDIQPNKDTGKPSGDSWKNYVPYSWGNPDELPPDRISYLTNTLKYGRDKFRRYRDLSYIITAGVYALCMLDAYVDAQLFDFDISPDLGMRVEPVLYQNSAFSSSSVGLQCSLSF